MSQYIITVPHLYIDGKFERGLIYIYQNNTWKPIEPAVYTDKFKSGMLGQAKLGELVLNGG